MGAHAGQVPVPATTAGPLREASQNSGRYERVALSRLREITPVWNAIRYRCAVFGASALLWLSSSVCSGSTYQPPQGSTVAGSSPPPLAIAGADALPTASPVEQKNQAPDSQVAT